eukprot:4631846-Pleurochrysis_carterae.AAC.1
MAIDPRNDLGYSQNLPLGEEEPARAAIARNMMEYVACVQRRKRHVANGGTHLLSEPVSCLHPSSRASSTCFEALRFRTQLNSHLHRARAQLELVLVYDMYQVPDLHHARTVARVLVAPHLTRK